MLRESNFERISGPACPDLVLGAMAGARFHQVYMPCVILARGGSDLQAPVWMPQSVTLSDAQKDGEIEEAVKLLGAGDVVAFPTDTLYGLGADVFSVKALERIFVIKGRPNSLALPVLVGLWEQVKLVARFTGVGRKLAARFWPGPLTLVLPKLENLPKLVTGGRDTVAVRMPDHHVPLVLAEQLGGPITGTSANLNGGPDLHTLAAVQAQLGNQVHCIIQTGPHPKGIPSTVVDVTGERPRLLRQGALPFQDILATLD